MTENSQRPYMMRFFFFGFMTGVMATGIALAGAVFLLLWTGW